MKDINNDILIDTNDYEEQKKLLSDEKKENQDMEDRSFRDFGIHSFSSCDLLRGGSQILYDPFF